MAGLATSLAASSAASSDPAANAPPSAAVALWRELLALLLLVVLADLTIFRGAGFAGLAALMALAPLVLIVGLPGCRPNPVTWIFAAMLLFLAVRMVWLGSSLCVVVGAFLTIAFSLGLQGRSPTVPDTLAGFGKLTFAGGFGFAKYGAKLAGCNPRFSRFLWLSFLLPLVALFLFGTLFILANPDLVKAVSEGMERFGRWLTDLADTISGYGPEALFWIFAAYVASGLLQPAFARRWVFEHQVHEQPQKTPPSAVLRRAPDESPLYNALRNTLCAVIGLFAVYLVFEFKTLWFRRFPPGFYYAGYAHEGAAWLTAALALATVVLSLIFRGRVLRDPRIGSLRRLAWIWSAENLILALTVYNRMYIYIDFNGMTRMRMIGLFGISTVVVGFFFVLWKILRHHDFLWLIHRQLWSLAAAIYLFALTPIDTFVQRYNARQVLSGDLAPAVQISVHPISAEGYLVLQPLVHCQDPIIRDGVQALLAEKEADLERLSTERSELGWTSFQLADRLLLVRLRARHQDWNAFSDQAQRDEALDRFRRYAYQWY